MYDHEEEEQPLGGSKNRPTKCGLCQYHFPKLCMRTVVTRKSIFNVQRQFSQLTGLHSGHVDLLAADDNNPSAVPSSLYAPSQVCKFCSQFFGVHDVMITEDQAEQAIELGIPLMELSKGRMPRHGSSPAQRRAREARSPSRSPAAGRGGRSPTAGRHRSVSPTRTRPSSASPPPSPAAGGGAIAGGGGEENQAASNTTTPTKQTASNGMTNNNTDSNNNTLSSPMSPTTANLTNLFASPNESGGVGGLSQIPRSRRLYLLKQKREQQEQHRLLMSPGSAGSGGGSAAGGRSPQQQPHRSPGTPSLSPLLLPASSPHSPASQNLHNNNNHNNASFTKKSARGSPPRLPPPANSQAMRLASALLKRELHKLLAVRLREQISVAEQRAREIAEAAADSGGGGGGENRNNNNNTSTTTPPLSSTRRQQQQNQQRGKMQNNASASPAAAAGAATATTTVRFRADEPRVSPSSSSSSSISDSSGTNCTASTSPTGTTATNATSTQNPPAAQQQDQHHQHHHHHHHPQAQINLHNSLERDAAFTKQPSRHERRFNLAMGRVESLVQHLLHQQEEEVEEEEKNYDDQFQYDQQRDEIDNNNNNNTGASRISTTPQPVLNSDRSRQIRERRHHSASVTLQPRRRPLAAPDDGDTLVRAVAHARRARREMRIEEEHEEHAEVV